MCIASALLGRMAERGLAVPRILVIRYDLPARVEQTAAAIDDALRSLCAGKRILLAGDSAGAFLAVATRLRNAGGGPPVLAVCPWLDLLHNSDAHTRNASHDSIEKAILEHGAALFIAPESGAAARQAASPAYSPRVGCLPSHSMLVVYGEREILADDGVLLRQRALDAGAPSDAVALYKLDDGVWGAHNALLALPLAQSCSPAVCDAFDVMTSFVVNAMARQR